MSSTDGDSEMQDVKIQFAGDHRLTRTSSLDRVTKNPVLLSILFTSIFWWLTYAFLGGALPEEYSSSTVELTCGNSTTEARALGCKFELLSLRWLPEPCYDEEINDAFKKSVEWRGYKDMQGNGELSIDEMSEMINPLRYYTTIREHAAHCAFMWQKQHRGYLRGGSRAGLYLDDSSLDFAHTRHCAEFLMTIFDYEPSDLEFIATQNIVQFSTCTVEV